MFVIVQKTIKKEVEFNSTPKGIRMAKRKRPDKYTTAIVNDRLRWRPGFSPLCQAPAKEFAVLEVFYPRLPVRLRESRELPPASGRTIPVAQG